MKRIRKSTGRKRELAQPDEVTAALQDTYSVIETYRYWIVGAIAVVIVIVLAVSGFFSWRASQRQKETEAFFKVFEVLSAEVVPEAEKTEGEEPAASPDAAKTFATKDAKFQALADGASQYLGEHAGGLAEAARLLLVTAYMNLNKNDEALTELKAFLDKESASSLRPLVLENLGSLQLRTGAAEDATKSFEEMQSGTSEPYFQARALVHLGDMVNPILAGGTAAQKSAAKAREYYQKAMELLPAAGSEESLLPDLTALARHDVQVRLLLTPES